MSEASIICVDFMKIIHEILLSAHEDYCGLYETYWALPPGEIVNESLRLSKKFDISLIMNINYKLICAGHLDLFRTESGVAENTKDYILVLDELNYAPFSISDGVGLLLSSTNSGESLLKKTYRRYGIPDL